MPGSMIVPVIVLAGYLVFDMIRKKNHQKNCYREAVTGPADMAGQSPPKTIKQLDVSSKESLEKVIGMYRYPKKTLIPARKASTEIEKLVFEGIAAGDIAGMPYEMRMSSVEDPDTVPFFKEYAKFTDDTAMAYAVWQAADRIRKEGNCDAAKEAGLFAEELKKYAKKYPYLGYGFHFAAWAINDIEQEEYASFGNGSAMRSGVIGAMFDTQEEVIRHAALSAVCSHNHPEGVKGAVVTAMLVFMGRCGCSKEEMLDYITGENIYPLEKCAVRLDELEKFPWNNPKQYISPAATIEDLKNMYPKTVSEHCQIAVPEAVANFLQSDSYEGCIRNSFRYCCDTDTVAAISGGIAAAFYNEIPDKIREECHSKLVDGNLFDEGV